MVEGLFFVLCGSNFDLIFGCVYAIILLDSVDVVLVVTSKMTTYLTIDSSGAHGNNGYKTAKEDLPWSGNGYKKAFAVERTFLALFGMSRPGNNILISSFQYLFSNLLMTYLF